MGEDCAGTGGDFSFAIWINNTRNSLREGQPGVRSLYYYETRDFFVFGSEIKALTSLPEFPQS